MEQLHDTREGWLSHAFVLIEKRFASQGYALPQHVKISCGFPVGSRGGKKILGQAISQMASADGFRETFVSPTISDPLLVLGVTAHEYGHHAVGVEAGHGPKFKAFCKAVGLEGKATQALPGAALNQWLRDEVLPMLGAYPHSAVDPSQRKKQGTRMIKLVCPETRDEKGNPYTVRMTRKWFDAYGAPLSPAGCKMVLVESESEEDSGE